MDRVTRREGAPPRKRVKTDQSSRSAYHFTRADDIRRSLHAQTQDGLTEALLALRNQFTIRAHEGPIAPHDERLLLARSWLDAAPAAHELFSIWETLSQRQAPLLSLVVSVLASLLNLLSSHYTQHSAGSPIVKTLLASQWMQQLNTYVTGAHNDLIIATLKLLNAMSQFAGGSERKTILDGFAWEMKSLPKLFFMRRKTKTGNRHDILAVPDIRTLYILFILSFVDSSTPTGLKSTFLEQRRDVFIGIWKGLAQDPYSLVRKVLEVSWAGIWSDPKLKRTLKVSLFNEMTLGQIVKLYERSMPEDEDSEQIPADLIHHFLLAICTRPGVGVCFRDRGWYLRESEDDARPVADDADVPATKPGRIFNKILAHVLKGLKVNEDPRQQELAVKIISACPELVASYWSAAALTLEPRLSSKWIANVSFLGFIISLPVPEASFLLPNSALYVPAPPPLSSFLENTLPSVGTKIHFSRGLQSSSPLVQHCTAQTLAKCLTKYAAVIDILEKVARALEEDDESGQWGKRKRELEREARRRVPEFQVIVALSQQPHKQADSIPSTGEGTAPIPTPNATRTALLAESSTRLLWLYHRCLPSLVAEARFDVGKLLQNFSDSAIRSVAQVENEQESGNALLRLHTARQLHILRLLGESDQFAWSSKTGSHSPIYTLLQTYAAAEVTAIRTAVESLLRRVFSDSIMFQHDPDEVYTWLAALPIGLRAADAEAPDGVALLDEREAVTKFLDDCVQRFLKTPYRYIEDLQNMVPSSDESTTLTAVGDQDSHPSPLVMTVLEQFSAKVLANLLPPSDTLALASFIRKLVTGLAGKLQNIHILIRFADRFAAAISKKSSPTSQSLLDQAVASELAMIRAYFSRLHGSMDALPKQPYDEMAAAAIATFLGQIEQLEPSSNQRSRILAAYELVDWVRLVGSPLQNEDLARLAAVIEHFHPPAVKELLDYLDPRQDFLPPTAIVEIPTAFTFGQLFIRCSIIQLADLVYQDVLSNAIIASSRPFWNSKAALILLRHRLSSSRVTTSQKKDILSLMTAVVRRAGEVVTTEETHILKEVLFGFSELKDFCISKELDPDVQYGLETLLRTLIDPKKAEDIQYVSGFSSHWAALIKTSPDSTGVEQITLWIPYMNIQEILTLLDQILQAIGDISKKKRMSKLLPAVLTALEQYARDSTVELGLLDRLPQLISLGPAFPASQMLQNIVAVAVNAGLPLCLDGLSLPPGSAEQQALSSWTARSESHWSHRLQGLKDDAGISFIILQPFWTDQALSILKGLIYLNAHARHACLQYLETAESTLRPTAQIASILWALLDSSEGQDLPESQATEIWQHHFTHLLQGLLDTDSDRSFRLTCRLGAFAIIKRSQSMRPTFLSILQRIILELPRDFLTDEFLLFGRSLLEAMPAEAKETVSALIDHGLQWAARSLVDSNSQSSETIRILDDLIGMLNDVKAHLADTLLSIVVQNHLSNSVALKLVTTIIPLTHMKPLIVNRHLQNVIQHPSFFRCTSALASSRDAAVRLVSVLFHSCPHNTCQPSHIQPLAQVYFGSLTTADRRLLGIFRLYEDTRKTSVASLLSQGSPKSSSSSNARELIGNLDSNRVFRTCLAFPAWRKLSGLDHHTDQSYLIDDLLYDPVFITLLSSQMLASCQPSFALEWVQFFRSNVVSLLIRALSSKDDMLRDLALSQIAAIASSLQTADMQEKSHVLHIFGLLRDAIRPPGVGEPSPRLPTFTTLLLAHALRGVFYPANFIYPLTARFLLQRPELDATDIPMLYNMMYSSSDDWKKERVWVLKFISDGMLSAGGEEWRVFKRRHTWDLLASVWQGGEYDRALRNGVMDILVNLTSNRRIVTSLILKSALLSWIEIVLLAPREDESFIWMKILDNILTVVDAEKLEDMTGREWRASIGRCLSALSGEAVNTLHLGSGLTMKLSLLPGPEDPNLQSLIAKYFQSLNRLEGALKLPTSKLRPRPMVQTIHTSYTVREEFALDPVEVWGGVVTTLWRSAMSLETKGLMWDNLTARLLIWRSTVGDEEHGVGAWVRREVVRNRSRP